MPPEKRSPSICRSFLPKSACWARSWNTARDKPSSPKAIPQTVSSIFGKAGRSSPSYPAGGKKRSSRFWAWAILSARDAWRVSACAWRLRPRSDPAPCSELNKEMMRVLHGQQAFSDLFIRQVLLRNIRVEADLVDQLFNSSEKRLARALLLIAHYGNQGEPQTEVPPISQETLAEMIGSTRTRVNFFMNKFRKLGFIEYNGGLKVHNSLLSVVLHD